MVPFRVNEFLPNTSFEQIERCSSMSSQWDDTLERYYVVKLNSMQFFGPPNFGLSLLDGLESLLLTMPIILWLSRALSHLPPVEALQRAIQLVNDHFGGNPMLGFPHIQYLALFWRSVVSWKHLSPGTAVGTIRQRRLLDLDSPILHLSAVAFEDRWGRFPAT